MIRRMKRIGGNGPFAIVTLIALAVVVLASVAFVLAGRVNAAADAVTGQPIPTEYRMAILAAGGSCGTVSPARVAASLMVESSFMPTATNVRGGRGLAGLTTDEWNAWKPWGNATRTDGAANILAFAHMLCDTIGHLRVDNVKGDLWQLAVAAYYTGLDSVTSANGVPPAAQNYVNQVSGYAAYYEQHGDLIDTPSASPSDSASPSLSAAAASPSPSATSPTPTAARTTGGPKHAATTSPATTSPASTSPPGPAGPKTSGQFYNAEANKCLTAGGVFNGSHLQLAACDGSDLEHWQLFPDGTIRAVGLCMDVAGANPADFTQIQVANCSGNPAQQFTYDLAANHIHSTSMDKCVNIEYTLNPPGVLDYSCLNQGNQWFVLV